VTRGSSEGDDSEVTGLSDVTSSLTLSEDGVSAVVVVVVLLLRIFGRAGDLVVVGRVRGVGLGPRVTSSSSSRAGLEVVVVNLRREPRGAKRVDDAVLSVVTSSSSLFSTLARNLFKLSFRPRVRALVGVVEEYLTVIRDRPRALKFGFWKTAPMVGLELEASSLEDGVDASCVFSGELTTCVGRVRPVGRYRLDLVDAG